MTSQKILDLKLAIYGVGRMEDKAGVPTPEIKLQRYEKVSVSLGSPLGELAYSHILLNLYLALLFSLLFVFNNP